MSDLNDPKRREESVVAKEPTADNNPVQIRIEPGNTEILTVKLLYDILEQDKKIFEQLKEIAYYCSHLEKKQEEKKDV